MKTYYELLGVEPAASADVVKHAFRRQISRYHPDKVEHLGQEFMEIASQRAAELTEAYRVLTDEDTRRQYDESLRAPLSAGAVSTPSSATVREHPAGKPEPSIAHEPPPDRETQAVRATSNEFLKREVVARLREAVATVTGWDQPATVPGFDAVFVVGDASSVFRKTLPELVVLAKITTSVDAASVRQVWGHALRAAVRYANSGCVLLIGNAVASSSELSHAIADERRKARRAGPVLVPVDMRDWEALFPTDVPVRVRAILQRLRAGAA